VSLRQWFSSNVVEVFAPDFEVERTTNTKANRKLRAAGTERKTQFFSPDYDITFYV
jgi:hypothetical protein